MVWNFISSFLSACLLVAPAYSDALASIPPQETASRSTSEGGAMTLAVDLRDLQRSLVHVQEHLTMAPGPLTLVYPKWAPGEHSPSGPVGDLAGLHATADGKDLAWTRDDVDIYAIHLDMPKTARGLDIRFDLVVQPSPEAFPLNWAQVLFLPLGWTSDATSIQGSLQLPETWKFASALALEPDGAGKLRFRPLDLTTLVDSPVVVGPNLKQIEFSNAGGIAHRLDLFSVKEADAQVDEATLAHLKAMVTEAQALFGARHYDHYDFLISLTAWRGSGGKEHHQSTEIGLPAGAFSGAARRSVEYLSIPRVVPHEFVHSWNGKYRRPRGLATPDFQQPMRGKLLWIYEGLTDYLGRVLASRSGLNSLEEAKDLLAYYAARMVAQNGRDWRPLEDTTADPLMTWRAGGPWASYRRNSDYYYEGSLLWLDVDSLIRAMSHGQKSLDDFCKAFFGGQVSGPALVPYDLEQVLEALNTVQAYDWAGFFQKRVAGVCTSTPAEALAACGWRLAWSDVAASTELMEAGLWRAKGFDAQFSLGFVVQPDGLILDLDRGGPADRAGLAPQMKILGLNGKVWSLEGFQEALKHRSRLQFLVAQNEDLKTIVVDYRDGERHPHLERIPGQPDFLTGILSPKIIPTEARNSK